MGDAIGEAQRDAGQETAHQERDQVDAGHGQSDEVGVRSTIGTEERVHPGQHGEGGAARADRLRPLPAPSDEDRDAGLRKQEGEQRARTVGGVAQPDRDEGGADQDRAFHRHRGGDRAPDPGHGEDQQRADDSTQHADGYGRIGRDHRADRAGNQDVGLVPRIGAVEDMTHPQALQKSHPSFLMTVKLPHSRQREPFMSAGSASPRGASRIPISRVG